MWRLNESFHPFMLFSPVNPTHCYLRMNQNFWFSFGYWQAICNYYFFDPYNQGMEKGCRRCDFCQSIENGVSPYSALTLTADYM
jgi:hypothetical protein